MLGADGLGRTSMVEAIELRKTLEEHVYSIQNLARSL
jgi:hypothetical protein